MACFTSFFTKLIWDINISKTEWVISFFKKSRYLPSHQRKLKAFCRQKNVSSNHHMTNDVILEDILRVDGTESFRGCRWKYWYIKYSTRMESNLSVQDSQIHWNVIKISGKDMKTKCMEKRKSIKKLRCIALFWCYLTYFEQAKMQSVNFNVNSFGICI